MKHTFLKVFLIMTMLTGAANAAEKISLPKPIKTGGMPVMEAIDKRQSGKEFADKPIDNQTLSEILWVAYGMNVKGTRTIPTARNQQNMRLYVVMANGAWLYDAKKHQLELVTKKDLRDLFVKGQDYMKTAPLNLVFVVNDDDKWGELDAGASYQNVGLYAASKGLNAVVRGYFEDDKLEKELRLKNDYEPKITMAIGYPK